MIITIAELLSRFALHDYTFGEWIFVTELVLVAVFMLYYTNEFIKLVNEVQKTLGIEFCDEKN